MTVAERTQRSAAATLTERYRMLAFALCARPLQFELAGGGASTHTDGSTIFLRAEADDADRRIEVAVQAALIAAGSLAPAELGALVGRPARARRYLQLEVARTVASGSALLRLILGDFGDSLALPPPTSRSAAESLELARAKGISIELDPRLGELCPGKLLANREAWARGAPRPEDLRSPPTTPRKPRDPQLGDDEEADEIPTFLRRFFSLPFNVTNPFADLFRKLLGARRASGGNEAPGAEIATAATKSTRAVSQVARAARYSVDFRETESPARLVSRWVYPEWDGLEGAYRRDWCVVHEIPVGWVSDRARGPLAVPRDPWLEKSLARLALGFEDHRRQRDGDRIDLDATIELASVLEGIRRRGEGALDRAAIYSGMRRTRRDLAALLLVDISGSSAEREHGGNTVLTEQWQTASALTQALAAVDDRVAAVAFHSRGREAVRVVTLKDFHERWSRDAGSAMRSLRASGYTRLGTAIRHGAHRLLHDSGAERRLLIIVSDGFPFDLGYNGEYARRDVERALEECAEQELRVLWICFGSMDPGLAGFLSASSFPLLTADRYASVRRRLVPAIASALLTRIESPRRAFSSAR